MSSFKILKNASAGIFGQSAGKITTPVVHFQMQALIFGMHDREYLKRRKSYSSLVGSPNTILALHAFFSIASDRCNVELSYIHCYRFRSQITVFSCSRILVPAFTRTRFRWCARWQNVRRSAAKVVTNLVLVRYCFRSSSVMTSSVRKPVSQWREIDLILVSPRNCFEQNFSYFYVLLGSFSISVSGI